MGFFRGSAGFKGVRRVGSIAKVLIKHGLGDVVERIVSRKEKQVEPGKVKPATLKPGVLSPRRVRLILEELGPSFVKLGQLMSTRADIFPPEYIEELRKLQDRVPPIPYSEIEKVIEEELKQPVAEIFSEFNREPFAAASVAQVHHATLPSGEKVVVKVIRPGIIKKVREDIRLMYYLADKIEKSFDLGRILAPTNLVREFERTIFKEIDMLIEAGSVEKFAHNFREVDELYIPKVYWDYITKSILVMERIDGIKMDHVDELKAHGIDPKEVARIGLRSFSRQLMEFGFFHADPHPGNTIVMYDGRVSLVDFGITGYLDEETMRQIANIFLGYAEHDYDMVMDAFLEAGLINEETIDLDSFRIDLKDASEAFYGRSLQSISVKDVYDQIIYLALKYHIQLPRNLLLILKTFVQTEALGKILESDASLLEFTKPYAKNLLERGYDAKKIFKNIGRDTRYVGKYAKVMPKFVHDILKQVAKGKQRVEIWHEGFQQLDIKFEKGLNRLTVGLVISASIIAAAMVLNSAQKVLVFNLEFFGLGAVSLTTILGVVGYVIATVLGVWLIVSIYRSGKL
ncbi:MAG: AarF/ABC1/UbiB kinase family protein [Deltaproteobacteria bacterium]|nr:MAG: AarF/ABC1/UbiB kinase family protein [Deltaproteobacteria bacterium]